MTKEPVSMPCHVFKVEKTERELSHHHRGVGIYFEGIGYLAEWDGHSVFSNRWWRVERKIDELKGKKNL